MSKPRKKYNDCWMYILLLATLVILTESLKTYTFTLFDIDITYSMILIPFIFFLTNYITKKYGFRRSLVAIIVSAISLVSFVLLMNFAIGRTLEFSSISGELLGYVISQMVNTMIYKFLLVNTNSPYYLVLLNLIFSHIVFYMIYTLVHLNMIILDTFWVSYFMVLGIQSIMCIILSIIDKKIKVGIGKDD